VLEGTVRGRGAAAPPGGFIRAASRPRPPYTVDDVAEATALVRTSFGASTRQGASAGRRDSFDFSSISVSPDGPARLPLPTETAPGDTVAPVLRPPLYTLPPSACEHSPLVSTCSDGASSGTEGASAPLEAAFAALGYDAQACADICTSRAYPSGLISAGIALSGDPPASAAAVRAAFDAGAGALLARLSPLVESQRAMLAQLDAAITAASTPSEAVAALTAKKERRKMVLKWCTVCLRPTCNFRPIIKEWEEDAE
jgi:hypothetical protein